MIKLHSPLLPKRKFVMITGAGTSISFGIPSTLNATALIENSFRNTPGISPSELSLFDTIKSGLENYLINPGNVSFEDIYQSIQDVRALQCIPKDPEAFDEFRPRVGATHILNEQISLYSEQDGRALQNAYLNNILDTFFKSLPSMPSNNQLSPALEYIQREYIVWSFTLNYDNLISDVWSSFASGFIPGSTPRVFNPSLLLSALRSKRHIHSHLHGSLKWGFPTNGFNNPFELHEFDTPNDGIRNSKSRPSGRPLQKGGTIPLSPIITGLDKTELVFRQPFFTNFMAFYRALDLCSDLLIAGYGFSDRHVNMGIHNCREHHPDVRTYIIDKNDDNCPISYIHDKTPDAWSTIQPGDEYLANEVPAYPGWWKIPGITAGRHTTGPVFLWLKGFDVFCKTVVNNGLPK